MPRKHSRPARQGPRPGEARRKAYTVVDAGGNVRVYPSKAEALKAVPQIVAAKVGLPGRLSPQQKAEAYLQWAASHRSLAPVLPLSAFDRENLYGDAE